MFKFICKFILWISGWKSNYSYKLDDKCIVIAAPHTSMWDFVLALLFLTAMGGRSRFMIKKEMFFFPVGGPLKLMGGIPVDRSPGNSMVDKIASKFKDYDKFHLTITPEGTRKKVDNWKRGFYFIAKRAKVPIYVGFVDYKKKELGILSKFEPTDNISEDMARIKLMFKDVTPKHPERFSIGKVTENPK